MHRAMPAARALSISIVALSFAITGCPTEGERPPKDAPPAEDDWSRMSASKEWLYATGDFSGPHKAECDHVLGWIKGETTCKGSLCEHARELAGEFIRRCAAYEEAAVIEVARSVQVELTGRATEAPSDCGKAFDDLVREGCSAAECQSRGQRWATRCAKTEGSPLVLRILQRVVDRRRDQGAEASDLDPRTCDELRAEVMEAGKCKDRFVCEESTGRVLMYRERCESEAERPTIATAVAELTVLVGGGKPPEAILTRAGSGGVAAGEVPVPLSDGSGGVIFVCEDRASDLARYASSRKTCQGGKLVVARAFPTSKGVEVRAGALDFPDDATFSARYPTILATGELELRDKEAAAALAADLGKAAELGKSSGGVAEAARILARAVVAHVLAIKRSPGVRAELTHRDELLSPALKEIAKGKLAASRGLKVPAAEAAGLLTRARTCAFADIAADGSVQAGAPGRAFTLSTTALLPRAMEGYLSVLKGARPAKLAGRAATAEKERGLRAAEACGASEKRLQEIKKSLVSCNFGLEACDSAKHASFVKSVDEARVAAESAFHEMESARTADAADAEAIHHAAEAAGCREPWW
jgi:hypothetical protein